jgi:hypothetical protein
VPEGFSFDFDTIELVNGFDLPNAAVLQKNLEDWFALLNVGRRYTAVGNSDSHSLVYQWAGYPRTYVKVDEDDPRRVRPEQVAEALRRGHAQISNGIFVDLVVGAASGPGDLLTIANATASVRLAARAAPYVDVQRAELWVNGRLAAQTMRVASPAQQHRIQWTTQLEVARDSWVVAIVRGDRELGAEFPGGRGTPLAITNPVFLDADGDGRFTPPLGLAPVLPPGAPPTASP